jgi:hypothetical protein
MRERLSGLGRRLIAYAVIVVAVVILLRVVLGTVLGFLHMLVLAAAVVFAIYALFWAQRFKRGA